MRTKYCHREGSKFEIEPTFIWSLIAMTQWQTEVRADRRAVPPLSKTRGLLWLREAVCFRHGGELPNIIQILNFCPLFCMKMDKKAISDISDVISGVIQGSAVGPLMFLAYLNELAEILANCGIKVKFFADA